MTSDRVIPDHSDGIIVGNIDSSVAAIGHGAQVIINNIQQATSVEVAEQAEVYAHKRLGEAIAEHVNRLRIQSERARERSGSPYKALLEYDIDDAAMFYSRSDAIKAVMDRLEKGPLTVLHADSGAGKTSLLKAGVQPRLLADGHVPLYVRPMKMPVPRAVKRGLLPQLEQMPNLADASLHDFLRQAANLLGGQRLVIMIDQFEEVFTLQRAEARDQLVDDLAPCLEDDSLPVRWILALRSESFGQLSTFQPRVKQPFANEYLLRAFGPADAEDIIKKPAEYWGVYYEEGLPEEIIRDLGGEKIEPPQLQLVCSTLFEALKGGARITRATYSEVGLAQGILRNHLDRVVNYLPNEYKSAARRVLEALVTSEGRRAIHTRSELVAEVLPQDISEAALDFVLPRLYENRLLHTVEAEDVYELAHDYLLGEIEIDPAIRARKAAQELLARELETYQSFKRETPLSVDKLKIIETQRDQLSFSDRALELLLHSALDAGQPLDWWRDTARANQKTEALAEQWIGRLDDKTFADKAIRLLACLSDAVAVSRLRDWIKSQTAEGDEVLLNNVSPRQRKALMAIAQMECEEADKYLRELTPPGYSLVPAGRFVMGSDDRSDEQPRKEVRLPAFWIALAPVTIEEWHRFIDSGLFAQRRFWTHAQAGVGTAVPRRRLGPADEPVRDVTWHEAMAYAVWLAEDTGLPVGLPTEAEWEKAASWERANNGQARRYPWGDKEEPGRCNVQGSNAGAPTLPGRYSPDGDSPCSAKDMAGNVLEWTRSGFRSYPYDPADGREGLDDLPLRVLRGGAFNLPIKDARCARRHALDPALALTNTGFRVCLRLVPLMPAKDGASSATDPVQN